MKTLSILDLKFEIILVHHLYCVLVIPFLFKMHYITMGHPYLIATKSDGPKFLQILFLKCKKTIIYTYNLMR